MKEGEQLFKFIKQTEQNNSIPIEIFPELAYYCWDFFNKRDYCTRNEVRWHYENFFGGMGVYFCFRYIQKKGDIVYNNKADIDFFVEMAMFFEISGKYDEQFYLLNDIVMHSNNSAFKLRAVIQILMIGGLNDDIRISMTNIKEKILSNYYNDEIECFDYTCPICHGELLEPAYYKVNKEVVASWKHCPHCGYDFTELGDEATIYG